MTNKIISEEQRDKIRELVIKGYRGTTIQEKLNLTRNQVFYAIKKIRGELEYRSEDIIAKFSYEYQKLNEAYDQTKEATNEELEQLLQEEKKDYNMILSYRRFLHDVDKDKYNLYMDSDLVLALRRIKDERITSYAKERVRKEGTPLIRG